MANYNQYDGNMVQTSMAQRLLDNGSDYAAVRVSQFDYLFVQGHVDLNNSNLSYSGQSWIYSSDDRDLTYNEEDSGNISISYPDYVYSNIPDFQSLSVIDVYPKLAFYAIVALIFLFVGFQCIKRRFVL